MIEISNLNEIRNLLDATAKIQTTLKHTEKLLGKNFNIFTLIRSGHEEVSVHSAFIGSLLDVDGPHDMGDTFQKIFIEQALGSFGNMWIKNPYLLKIEQSFGKGRMDLVLENQDCCIIIENKIYAGDQYEQIDRYIEYAKNTGKSYKILYLTLWKNEPSEMSLNDRKQLLADGAVICISYAETIVNWLQNSLAQTLNKSYIRENIQQYLDLIKNLTGTQEESMHTQIKKYVTENVNPDSLKYLNNIVQSLDLIRGEAVKTYLEEIQKYFQRCSKSDRDFHFKLVHKTNEYKDGFTKEWDVPSVFKISIGEFFDIEVAVWRQFWKGIRDAKVSLTLRVRQQYFEKLHPLIVKGIEADNTFKINKDHSFDLLLPEVQKINFFQNYDFLKAHCFDSYVAETIRGVDILIQKCEDIS